MNQKSIDLQSLTTVLEQHPELPLVFETGEMPISAGYHVTEIKHARINSLDCGHGVDEWEEITIQLVDGRGKETDSYMPTKTFLKIMDKATSSLGMGNEQQLFVEFGHQNGPMQKLNIVSIDHSPERMNISLDAKTASCKPFVRSQLAGATDGSNACCGAEKAQKTSSCCGDVSSENTNAGGACCS